MAVLKRATSQRPTMPHAAAGHYVSAPMMDNTPTTNGGNLLAGQNIHAFAR